MLVCRYVIPQRLRLNNLQLFISDAVLDRYLGVHSAELTRSKAIPILVGKRISAFATKVQGSKTIVSAACEGSTPSSLYQVELVLIGDGSGLRYMIERGHCTCPQGKFTAKNSAHGFHTCKHVAALAIYCSSQGPDHDLSGAETLGAGAGDPSLYSVQDTPRLDSPHDSLMAESIRREMELGLKSDSSILRSVAASAAVRLPGAAEAPISISSATGVSVVSVDSLGGEGPPLALSPVMAPTPFRVRSHSTDAGTADDDDADADAEPEPTVSNAVRQLPKWMQAAKAKGETKAPARVNRNPEGADEAQTEHVPGARAKRPRAVPKRKGRGKNAVEADEAERERVRAMCEDRKIDGEIELIAVANSVMRSKPAPGRRGGSGAETGVTPADLSMSTVAKLIRLEDEADGEDESVDPLDLMGFGLGPGAGAGAGAEKKRKRERGREREPQPQPLRNPYAFIDLDESTEYVDPLDAMGMGLGLGGRSGLVLQTGAGSGGSGGSGRGMGAGTLDSLGSFPASRAGPDGSVALSASFSHGSGSGGGSGSGSGGTFYTMDDSPLPPKPKKRVVSITQYLREKTGKM